MKLKFTAEDAVVSHTILKIMQKIVVDNPEREGAAHMGRTVLLLIDLVREGEIEIEPSLAADLYVLADHIRLKGLKIMDSGETLVALLSGFMCAADCCRLMDSIGPQIEAHIDAEAEKS